MVVNDLSVWPHGPWLYLIHGLPSIDSTVTVIDCNNVVLEYNISSRKLFRKDGLPCMKSPILGRQYFVFQGHCTDIFFIFWKCFLHRTKQKEQNAGKASHLRENGRLSFSRRLAADRQFSSAADVTQTYTPLCLSTLCHPLPPPFLSAFLCCVSSSFALLFFFSCSSRSHVHGADSGHITFFFPSPPSLSALPLLLLLFLILSVEVSCQSRAFCPRGCSAIHLSDFQTLCVHFCYDTRTTKQLVAKLLLHLWWLIHDFHSIFILFFWFSSWFVDPSFLSCSWLVLLPLLSVPAFRET